MNQTDPRIDAYITRSALFAIPILEHLRALVHAACPEANETMKWSFPHFEYKGSILCSMSSFKQHCAFGFWLGPQLTDPGHLLATGEGKPAMGNLGRITSVADLPEEHFLVGFIKEAMLLIDKGVKGRQNDAPREQKKLEIPDYIKNAMSANAQANDKFNKASYSFQKEYVEWVTEAKSEVTREKRLNTAIEWIADGKARNWKYEKK